MLFSSVHAMHGFPPYQYSILLDTVVNVLYFSLRCPVKCLVFFQSVLGSLQHCFPPHTCWGELFVFCMAVMCRKHRWLVLACTKARQWQKQVVNWNCWQRCWRCWNETDIAFSSSHRSVLIFCIASDICLVPATWSQLCDRSFRVAKPVTSLLGP